jgi:hypothetical protein
VWLGLQLLYDGVAQPLILIALDGVPVGTQSPGGARPTSVSLPVARRAELIVRGPDSSVTIAQVVTMAVDTGPAGDADPARPLILISARNDAVVPRWRMPVPVAPPRPLVLPAPAAAALLAMSPSVSRRLFFSQDEVCSFSDSITLVGLFVLRSEKYDPSFRYLFYTHTRKDLDQDRRAHMRARRACTHNTALRSD